MVKKVLFSAKRDDEVIQNVIFGLKKIQDVEIIYHDPAEDYFKISKIRKQFQDINFIFVKVANENSLNLLYFAELYQIPTLHDLASVLICKNKFALDLYLRNIMASQPEIFKNVKMPRSWNQNPMNRPYFKQWILKHLPVVIKSHYQQDQHNRFNFLVNSEEEIDYFYERYSEFIYYDVYIQEFIECDGMDRKIYVIGDEIFGIKRENPIYFFLREHPNNIDVNTLKRERLDVPNNIKEISRILAKRLNLKLFGFDLVSNNNEVFFLLDLNEFPGYKDVENATTNLINLFKNIIGS